MEREYRSSGDSWQEALRLSIKTVQLFRETSEFPPPPPPGFSLCNSTPLSSPVSAIGHTAGLLVETHGTDSNHHHPTPHELTSWFICQSASCCGAHTSCIPQVPVAQGFKRCFADISPLCFPAINTTFLSLSLQPNRLAPWSSSSWQHSRCLHTLGNKKVEWNCRTWGWCLLFMLTRHDHACHLSDQEFHSPAPVV